MSKITKMDNHYKLIVIADDRAFTDKCLNLFFSSLITSGSDNNITIIYLLVPYYSPIDKISFVVSEYGSLNINVLSIKIERTSDQYYVKFLIEEFLQMSNLQNDDMMLYLDYDHIFFSKN